MRAPILGLVALLATFPASPTLASDDCGPAGCACPASFLIVTFSPVQLGVGVGSVQGSVTVLDATYYLVSDPPASHGYYVSPWVYQEWNGVPGLQRHDEYCTTPGYAENPDMVVL